MFLTVKDLSQALQIKPSTLYAWAAQGKIPAVKIHGLIRFQPEEIDSWLKSFRMQEPQFLTMQVGYDTGSLETLIARAKWEAYNSPHGETRPKSSLTGREGDNGAR